MAQMVMLGMIVFGVVVFAALSGAILAVWGLILFVADCVWRRF